MCTLPTGTYCIHIDTYHTCSVARHLYLHDRYTHLYTQECELIMQMHSYYTPPHTYLTTTRAHLYNTLVYTICKHSTPSHSLHKRAEAHTPCQHTLTHVYTCEHTTDTHICTHKHNTDVWNYTMCIHKGHIGTYVHTCASHLCTHGACAYTNTVHTLKPQSTQYM